MKYRQFFSILFFAFSFFSVTFFNADAAILKINPNTGVYSAGKSFSVSVVLNTEGKAVNAADGQLTFNPRELQVAGVSRGASIFNLWTEEPTFSNSVGSVSFGGGSPTGYTGTSGNIVTVTFKALSAGTPKVQFKSGSVLAADGLGTNVLTAMHGGSYTVSAPSANPEPEYIAPANTPSAPQITSITHPDETKWYAEKNVKLSWKLPQGVVAIRTLLDDQKGTVPTIVYDELITEKNIADLEEGVSYFHIQFKNKEGWGKITHYRLAVDTEAPKLFTIEEIAPSATSTPEHVLSFSLDDISPILEYKIQIDGQEPFIYKDEGDTKKYTLETLPPGYHTFIIEAFDSAGNSTATTHSFTVEAFEKPTFFEYPERINTEIIPAIKGKTRPHAFVAVEVRKASDGTFIQKVEGGDGKDPYSILSDENGEFVYVPDASFERGVYIITATARDEFGRLSERSDEIKIIVEAPGYIVVGTMVVNALSVIIPLLATVLLLIFGSWYLWHRLSQWKKRVQTETREAEKSLTKEFDSLIKNLHDNVLILKESRKNKLTKEEEHLIAQIEEDVLSARKRIAKEIVDIENVIT